MKEGYQAKQRNTGKRQRKRIILFVTEGKNKTEENYVDRFRSKDTQVFFVKSNVTDPVKMIRDLIRDYKKLGLKSEDNDLAFCLVDGDASYEQAIKIKEADEIALKSECSIIVSNPSFEVWFLCHFLYSTKQYKTQEEVIDRLKEFIPEYEKNSENIYEIIKPFEKTGLMNARKLADYNDTAKNKLHSKDYLPSTEMYKVIDKINNKKGGQNNKT